MNDRTLEHAQRLLRHADNPLVLQENPLTESLDAGAVRRMLEQLCAMMADEARQHVRDTSVVRRYEIFRRCDLAGEPHSVVASDLGISRRQFYRERRIIARRVSDFFAPFALGPTSVDLARERDLASLLHSLPDLPCPSDSEIWLKRLALETRYSDILHESGRDVESHNLDAVIRRRLTGARGIRVGVALIQHAGIRLARRELERGNVPTAMTDLDLLGASVWAVDEIEQPA